MKGFLITIIILGLIGGSITATVMYAHGSDLVTSERKHTRDQRRAASRYVEQARAYTQEAYALLALDQTPGAEPARDDCTEHVVLAMYVMDDAHWDGREPTKALPGIAPTLPRAAAILDEYDIPVTALNESILREGSGARAKKLDALYDDQPRRAKRGYGDWDRYSLRLYRWFHPKKAEPLQRPSSEFASRFDRERDTQARANKRIEAYRGRMSVQTMQRIHDILQDFDALPYGCESIDGREAAETAKREMLERSASTIAFGWDVR